jgi:hypothetical protein
MLLLAQQVEYAAATRLGKNLEEGSGHGD